MLTGELPIGRFAPPSKKVQIDVRLDEVVLRALEKEPEQRYQQVSELKTQIKTIATTPPAFTHQPTQSQQFPRKHISNRHRIIFTLVTLTIFALIGGALLWTFFGDQLADRVSPPSPVQQAKEPTKATQNNSAETVGEDTSTVDREPSPQPVQQMEEPTKATQSKPAVTAEANTSIVKLLNAKQMKLDDLTSYRVDKKIADLPEFDRSTPENACATSYQLIVSNRKDKYEAILKMQFSFGKVRPNRVIPDWSVRPLEEQLSNAGFPKEVSEDRAKDYTNGFMIFEVVKLHENTALIYGFRGTDQMYIGDFFIKKVDDQWYNWHGLHAETREDLAKMIERYARNNKNLLQGDAKKNAPQVIQMEPENGAKEVDSEKVKELRVTFDLDMSQNGCSWGGSGNQETFPETGEPRWVDNRTCVLPVKLVAGKTYQLSINSSRSHDFRSTDDVPVEPVLYTFSTK